MPPKKSDNAMSWRDALKQWNADNNNHTWCIPKKHSHTMGKGWATKNTPEYDAVRHIQKHGSAAPKAASAPPAPAPKAPSRKGKERATAGPSAVDKYKAAMAMHGSRLKSAADGAIASSSSSAMKAAPERVAGAKGKGRIVLGG